MAKSPQARQWAKSMYIHENRTQAEIAEVVGVSRQTIVKRTQGLDDDDP